MPFRIELNAKPTQWIIGAFSNIIISFSRLHLKFVTGILASCKWRFHAESEISMINLIMCGHWTVLAYIRLTKLTPASAVIPCYASLDYCAGTKPHHNDNCTNHNTLQIFPTYRQNKYGVEDNVLD